MSVGYFRGGLNAMRGLAVAALVCALVTAFVPLAPKWRDFAGGMAVGLLLALTVTLFRAPQAEVQHLPHEKPADHQP